MDSFGVRACFKEWVCLAYVEHLAVLGVVTVGCYGLSTDDTPHCTCLNRKHRHRYSFRHTCIRSCSTFPSGPASPHPPVLLTPGCWFPVIPLLIFRDSWLIQFSCRKGRADRSTQNKPADYLHKFLSISTLQVVLTGHGLKILLEIFASLTFTALPIIAT